MAAPDTFGVWLRHHWIAVFAAFGTTVAMVSAVTKALSTVLVSLAGKETLVPYILHLVVLLALLILMMQLRQPPVGKDRLEELKRAIAAVRQFKRWWTLVITSWFFLYTLFAVKEFYRLKGTFQDDAHLRLWLDAETFLNNSQTLVLVLCFLVLSEASLEEVPSEHGVDYEESLPLPLAAVTLLAVTIGHVYIGHAFPSTYFYIALVSGLAAAVALAMFVGRLESKLIQVSKVIFPLFYLYAALQVLFALFDDTGPFKEYAQVTSAVVVGIVLPLKLLLFAFVYWCFGTGRLLFYVHQVHRINARVAGDWEQFQSTVGVTTPHIVRTIAPRLDV